MIKAKFPTTFHSPDQFNWPESQNLGISDKTKLCRPLNVLTVKITLMNTMKHNNFFSFTLPGQWQLVLENKNTIPFCKWPIYNQATCNFDKMAIKVLCRHKPCHHWIFRWKNKARHMHQVWSNKIFTHRYLLSFVQCKKLT